MKSQALLFALTDVDDSAILSAAALLGHEEETMHQNKQKPRRVFRAVLLIAAALAALGVTAYAAGVFGPRDVVLAGPLCTGEWTWSITYPAAIPETLDQAVRDQLENREAAWREWTAYQQQSRAASPALPDSFLPVRFEGYRSIEPQSDGSFLLRDYDREGGSLLNERRVSAEDMRLYQAHLRDSGQRYGNYASHYGVRSSEDARQLELIAAAHNLHLNKTEAFPFDEGGIWEAIAQVNPELKAAVERILSCLGEKPDPASRVYDDGGFVVYGSLPLPGKQESIPFVSGYSPYGSLDSHIVAASEPGQELRSWQHLRPDGIELTVVRSGESMMLYAFLDEGYFTLFVSHAGDLSDEELDRLADLPDLSILNPGS